MDKQLQILAGDVDKIEPWLRRHSWDGLSFTLIPSLLDQAKELQHELDDHKDADSELVRHLSRRLLLLRLDFRRDYLGPLTPADTTAQRCSKNLLRECFDRICKYVRRSTGFIAE